MFGKKIARRVSDYLEAPSRMNEKSFHCENIELSELYWSMADEVQLNAIDRALEQVLLRRNIGESNPYPTLTDDQVIIEFEKKKIAIIKAIPSQITERIKDRIDRLLKQNRGYATTRKMYVPSNTHLTVIQYFINYNISKDTIKLLDIQTRGYKK